MACAVHSLPRSIFLPNASHFLRNKSTAQNFKTNPSLVPDIRVALSQSSRRAFIASTLLTGATPLFIPNPVSAIQKNSSLNGLNRCSIFAAISTREISTSPELTSANSNTTFSPRATSTTSNTPPINVQKVFVAGATGATGSRIVRELLSRGVHVKAGVRSIEKANSLFGESAKKIEFVVTDVTAGDEALAAAIGADVDAVICATGFSPQGVFDPTLAWKVDNLGTVSLVDACRSLGISRFVLVSSLLTNGAAWGQLFNQAYIILNLFGLVLVAKLQAEKYIKRSGINYTIVRPGGLKNEPPFGVLSMQPQDTLNSGNISRDTVAQVAVEALFSPSSSFKTVEIISANRDGSLPSTAPKEKKSLEELFVAIPTDSF